MATATLTNGIVHLSPGVWSREIPVARLDYWIAFYRKMAKLQKRQSYQDVVDALVGVRGAKT